MNRTLKSAKSTMTTNTSSLGSTQTPVSSSWSDESQAGATLDNELRVQLFRSLTRIESHLKLRNPEALRRIRAWYSSQRAAAAAASDASCGAGAGSKQRRRKKHRQKRMEQNEISNAMLGESPLGSSGTLCLTQSASAREGQSQNKGLRHRSVSGHLSHLPEYLQIPEGVATRSLLVPPQPAWLFSDEPPPMLPSLGSDESVAGFQWLVDTNASNARLSSRRQTEREAMKQQLDRWIFLFFRILRRNWESSLVEEKKAAADANMYAEENIGKWTRKLRFKILRQAPVKVALNAFLSRMGLLSNASIVFCRDGFYGLMDVGNAYGDVTKTPCAMISFSSTPRYMGLKNGDSIYVNSCNTTQRQMMEENPRQDAPKNYRDKRLAFEHEEEGEYDFEVAADGSSSDNRPYYDI